MAEELPTADAPAPRGRLAHSGRINRVGQAWSQENEETEIEDYRGRLVRVKIPLGHFRCRSKGCSAIIRVDSRGFAFCVRCGQIYNDGPAVRGELSPIAKEVRKAKSIRACKAPRFGPDIPD